MPVTPPLPAGMFLGTGVPGNAAVTLARAPWGKTREVRDVGVHIGEVHTDVTAAPDPSTPAKGAAQEAPAAAQERWGELRRSAEALRWRTSAEGFDD